MRWVTALVPVAALVFAVAASLAGPAAGQSADQGSPIVVEGTVAMSIEDDFQTGRATRHYFLDQSVSGRRYELRLTPGQARSLQPGMRVRVRGRLVGNVMTVDHADFSVMILDAPSAVPPVKPR